MTGKMRHRKVRANRATAAFRAAATLTTCQCCEVRPVEVLMQIGTRRSDWLVQTCDLCLDLICADCAILGPDAVVCANCAQQQAIIESSGRAPIGC